MNTSIQAVHDYLIDAGFRQRRTNSVRMTGFDGRVYYLQRHSYEKRDLVVSYTPDRPSTIKTLLKKAGGTYRIRLGGALLVSGSVKDIFESLPRIVIEAHDRMRERDERLYWSQRDVVTVGRKDPMYTWQRARMM